MKTKNVNPIKFKDGTEWPAGTAVHIFVRRECPTMAILQKAVIADPATDVRRVRSISLFKWFDEFETYTMEDLEEAVCDSICPSLTGQSVEPDGWDADGFPSILLASGMC